jgi:2-polyprenyl-3-methyl-5-hydroxy-6-metoxy-1,4-benzoquinol methylase
VLELLDELNVKPCRKYVDIGCGDGSYTLIISKKLQCRDVYGVDIDEDRILLASKRGIITIKADLSKERLPLAENSIDIVTALEVIEHLVNPDNMLQETYKILKPGGYLIITTPNLASYINRIRLLFGFQPTYSEVSAYFDVSKICSKGTKLIGMPKPAGHLRLFTLRTLKCLLEIYGFEIVKMKASTSTFAIPNYIRIMDELVGRISPSLGRILIIVARKPL